jgi:hypothetical protein
LDPQGFWSDTVRAAIAGENWDDKVWGAIFELFDPALTESMGFARLMEAIHGEKQTGAKVWAKSDTMTEKWESGAKHVFGGITENGFLKLAEDMRRGLKGEVHGGKRYSLGEEVTALLTGSRVTTLDVPSKLSFITKDYTQDRNDARWKLRKYINSTGTQYDDQNQQAYHDSEKSSRRIFDEFSETVQAAIRIGNRNGRHTSPERSEREIRQVLDQSGLDKDTIDSVVKGEYQPFIPGNLDEVEKVMKYATPEHKKLLQEKREELLGTLLTSASGPGKTKDARTQTWQKQAELGERGISDEESLDVLRQRWIDEDQKAEKRRHEKVLELDAEEGVESPDVEEKVENPKWTKSRVQRLERLGLKEEDWPTIFGEE